MIRKQNMPMKAHSRFAAALLGLVVAAPAAAQTNIPVGPFRTIELNGAGRVLVRHAAVQQVRILQGNARISNIHLADGQRARSGRLIVDTCPNRCPIGYRLIVQIDTPDVDGLGVNGDGRIEVAPGFSRRGSIALGVNGKGRIDARAMAAAEASAGVNGDGEISLGRADRLVAGVNGKGRILYRGHPRLTSGVQGGGRVEQADP
jgi:hypothetical protein